MVFVKYTWLLIRYYTASHFLREVVRACSALWELPRWVYFSRAVYETAGLVRVFMLKAGANSHFRSTADQFLLLMSQVPCRPTCVDRGSGAGMAVASGRKLPDFFKT